MIVIILGMHRSGTSTVAGILHLNNIIMGTYENFWPRPLKQNPKGFYENYNFRKINDQILEYSGYHTKSYSPDLPEVKVSPKINKKMRRLVGDSLENFSDWGWKDPRTCFTVKYWVDVIDQLGYKNKIKIVFVTRRADSVARSLKKRNDLPILNGLKIWELYSKSILSFCYKSDLPIHFCSFEDFLNNPSITCNTLFDFLKRDFNDTIINKFIDKSISTSGGGPDIVYPHEITKIENEIYSKIGKR